MRMDSHFQSWAFNVHRRRRHCVGSADGACPLMRAYAKPSRRCAALCYNSFRSTNEGQLHSAQGDGSISAQQSCQLGEGYEKPRSNNNNSDNDNDDDDTRNRSSNRSSNKNTKSKAYPCTITTTS
ncbi:hypothetical protein EGR_03262 [Echinococcus granulosus]|uniref:Uncharacterized protein n=1 Tax=Echinococcus granulosus TaxID=6210 RepID=W6V6I3_ECHGR|nr:hypothetical protein EGR_03262 [Echinococcus granulosus]EUB61989.1 hypothetical protein EGR_03262 [Echinococcus granulosus]